MIKRTIEECIKNLTSMSNTLSPEFEMDLSESVKYLKKYKKILDKDSSENKELNDFFEAIWKLYPNKTNKSSIKNTTKKELKKIGYDKIKTSIEKYKQFIENQKRSGFNQRYQGGDRFFKGGTYKEYLSNENQVDIKDILKSTNTNIKRKDL